MSAPNSHRVAETGTHYAVLLDNGVCYLQRKQPLSNVDSPLSEKEEVIGVLCRELAKRSDTLAQVMPDGTVRLLRSDRDATLEEAAKVCDDNCLDYGGICAKLIRALKKAAPQASNLVEVSRVEPAPAVAAPLSPPCVELPHYQHLFDMIHARLQRNEVETDASLARKICNDIIKAVVPAEKTP